jgi:hypothetical protein
MFAKEARNSTSPSSRASPEANGIASCPENYSVDFTRDQTWRLVESPQDPGEMGWLRCYQMLKARTRVAPTHVKLVSRSVPGTEDVETRWEAAEPEIAKNDTLLEIAKETLDAVRELGQSLQPTSASSDSPPPSALSRCSPDTAPHPERQNGGRVDRRRRSDRIDADYHLEKLVRHVVNRVKRQGGGVKEIEVAVQTLARKSAASLAAEIRSELGLTISGRAIRRNSDQYRRWASLRNRKTTSRCTGTTSVSRRFQPGQYEIDRGDLVMRAAGSRRVFRGRTPLDLARDAKADSYLLNNGIDPADFPAE